MIFHVFSDFFIIYFNIKTMIFKKFEKHFDAKAEFKAEADERMFKFGSNLGNNI